MPVKVPLQALTSVDALFTDYDNFILDIWGVLHNGHQAFPGAIQALESLRNEGKEVILLSNAPRRSYVVQEDLIQFGITPDLYKAIHTSGEDVFEHLTQAPQPHKVFAISTPFHEHLIQDCKLEKVWLLSDADVIFNTGPDGRQALQFQDYKEILREARTLDLPMLCVNPDQTVLLGDQVVLCAGTLASFYESISGKVKYHGKPYLSVYESVLHKFKVQNKSRTIAIGDSLRTDIQGAQSFGIDSVLVLTGIDAHALNTLHETPLHPTFVMQALR